MWCYLKNLACSVVTGSMLTAGLLTTIGLSTQPALAMTNSVTCDGVEDESNSQFVEFGWDVYAVISLSAAASCLPQASSPGVDSHGATSSYPLSLLLNSFNFGSPIWLDNFEIQYHGGSVSNVTVNGVSVGTRHQVKLTSTTSFTVQYDYAGSTYHFTTTVVPNKHTMSGFTIQAGAVNSDPEITGDYKGSLLVPEGTTVVTDVNATDADGDTEGAGLTYSLTGGTDQASFNIDANTGILSFKSAPDFEVPGSPDGDNDYVVAVTVTDSAGATDTRGIEISVSDVNEDGVSPTVTLGDLAKQSDGTFTSIITLSESAGNGTAFDLSDLTVVNATAALSGSGTSFVATLTPSAPGVEVSLSVAASAFTDAAGNASVASNTVKAIADAEEETAEVISNILEGRSQTIMTHQPKIIRRIDRLNNRVNRLGRVSALGFTMQNNNLPFNADISRDGGRFSYSLNAARVSQADGTQNGITVTPTGVISALGGGSPDMARQEDAHGQIIVEPAMPPLPYALPANDNGDAERANARVTQAHSPLLAYANGEDAAAQEDTITTQPLRYDLWVEGVIGKQSTADGKGNFAIIHGGFDYLLTPDLLLGFGAQLDWSDYEAFGSAARADGTGYMMGPYATLKLTENFYLDGRAAWGQSFNKISPLGTYEDDVTSSRILLSGAVIGSFEMGAYAIEPEIRVNYFRDTIDTYVDSLGSTIAGYEVETGTLEFGPSLSRTMELESGLRLTPTIGVSGIWTFKSENTAETANAANTGSDDKDLHARLSAALAVTTQSNFTFTLSGSYDGIGNDDYEAMTGALKISKQW